nr:MAG TPA: hypothetical protein [Caudoviricetes sp.]
MDYCKFSMHIKSMVEDYLVCTVTGRPCAFQRYCIDRRTAIHTENAKTCKLRSDMNEDGTNGT